MTRERLTYLFKRYCDKIGTPGERRELMDAINEGESDPLLKELIDGVLQATRGELELDEDTAAAILQSIVQADKEQKPAIVRSIRRFTYQRIAAAAVIIILLSVGSYYYFNKVTPDQSKGTITQANKFKGDVAPGGNKAILTLSNGTQIVLDSAANGTLTRQGNAKIIKLDSGQLAYQSVTLSGAKGLNGEAVQGTPLEEVGSNTISTPRGGQYQVILSDGSKVWLNAASSLKFPALFVGNIRKVELTGEAYFEVAHDATKPFKVTVNGMEVQVLGTHFNINAYDDEDVIKTTLLEGSVKVTRGNNTLVIKPGQQILATNQQFIMNNNVDVTQVVAWQKGLFEFDNTDLPTIMRQVSRWYDVDVVYEGKPGDAKFGGGISKNLPLSNVLRLLEANGVKFTLEGKVLRVKL